MSTYPGPNPATDQRHGAARAASATHAWIWALVTFGYMLPWAFAASRGARNSAGVFWVNLLTGWTGLGWIVALVMAFSRHQYAPASATMIVQAAPAAAAPAATSPLAGAAAGEGRWAPDPTSRHQLRWWDGSTWTQRVLDGDTETSDPM